MLISTPDVIKNAAMLVTLWRHEAVRVIPDRFFEQADKDWFEKAIRQVCLSHPTWRWLTSVPSFSFPLFSV